MYSADKLLQQFDNWSNWSRSVGLLENANKTAVSGRLRSHVTALGLVFPSRSVNGWIRVLGACSASTARVLCPVEDNRLSSALRTADLLGTLGIGFARCFNLLRAFALSKANFGWISRAPTGLRAPNFGPVVGRLLDGLGSPSPGFGVSSTVATLIHLDVCWATVLAGAIVRGHRLYSPVWSLRPGTNYISCSAWLVALQRLVPCPSLGLVS